MLFNSYIFIFLFFPICLAGYYSLIYLKKKEPAQLFLILMSFWFYGYFQINYLLIMIFSITCNYIFHRIMSQKQSKPILFIAVASNLGLLFYFKYFDFFLTNINSIFGTSFLLRNILLPLGISFFTFQQIGFIVDTYRGEIKNCSLLTYALFVAFFPQLIAGPIVNQSEMLPQFEKMGSRNPDWEQIYRGLILFILGLFKKVILADTFGAGVDLGYTNIPILGRMDAILVIIFYSLQLYFDFSGYCDMARGIGAMLGIQIPVNFNSPYKAVNIVDFWKRWHITLNRFFTKYVYIPLGGNRKGNARMYANLLIVFCLSGIWHGAGWNFVIWGMMHGVLYVITRWWLRYSDIRKTSQNSMAMAIRVKFSALSLLKVLASRLLLFAYVSIAWVYFRAESIAQANSLLYAAIAGKVQKLSLDLAECFRLDEFWYVLKVLHLDTMEWSRYILMYAMLAAGIVLSMFTPNASEISEKCKGKILTNIIFATFFLWCVLSFSGVSTFLYFNF
ncbi:MAG: MBOAT family protein [Lachnospiraceae bacterium]|nr:MBOAT family protein [Lachnospiraceae bacterium]